MSDLLRLKNVGADGAVVALIAGLWRWILVLLVLTIGLVAGVSQAAAAPESPRIIGGSPASPGTWPWLAFIENSLPSGGYDLCSGTVVAANVVLTAGHCAVDESTMTVNPPQQYGVVTGSLDWTDAATRQVSPVSRVIVYPGFLKITSSNGSVYLDGDAALLQLTLPTTAPAMPLAADPGDSGLYAAGTPAAIAGWGLTSAGGSTPDQLQWAETVVQSTAYCTQQATNDFGALFDSIDQTCAIDAPTDDTGTCNGDSGGPLVALRPDDSLVQIGITSSGPVSCSTVLPDYFTRTDVLSAWITRWIAAMAPPTVTTIPASSVAQTSAQLNGQLNPNGSATNYYFQWGTSTAYGSSSTTGSTNNGVGVLPLSVTITGLSPATTYHYRLVGSSFNGTTYGADQTFTTASPPPSPPSPPSPLAGRYRGRTRQHWPITLRVGPGRSRLTALSFSFALRCTNHRAALSYNISPLGARRSWSLNGDDGLGFSHSFTDSQGTRYHVAGTFNTTGSVKGTLSATWKTRHYGMCTTGMVRWSATRS